MKNKTLRALVLVASAIPVYILSCTKAGDENLPVDPVSINVTASQVSLINSENRFAFDIFKNVLENSGESQNVIISPFSIASSLSMTLNGAGGQTRDSMAKALRMDGMSPESINTSYRDLTASFLNVDKRVLISVANSVWSEKNFEVKIPFRNILTEYYNAGSFTFDITDKLAYQAVNNWIEDKTNGLIKNMLDHLDDNTVMLLVNAIYFKGKWQSQFDKDRTANETFYRNDGTTVEVPMMKQVSDYSVYSGDGFIFAEFPYGQGNFVMDIILPDRQAGINSVLPLLNDAAISECLYRMAKTKTDLSFPRFKYGYKKELTDILTGMGMGIAFSKNADFSNISDLSLFISMVLHQAFIQTDEEGTEAAAATITGISMTMAPAQPFALKVDHSFIYLIRETSTNSILFLGKVADPVAN